MTDVSSHPDPDQHGGAEGSSPTYHPPAYLARQAAQSRPLSPYTSPTMPGKRWAGLGFGVLLLVLLVAICSGGVNAAGAFLGSSSATPTTAHTAGNRSSNSGLAAGTATATDTPTPAPTDTPTPSPTPRPTATSTPVPPTATPISQPTCIPNAVNCNPWGYNFSCCNHIYSPPSNFCDYFNCIPSFWQHTNGYVEECKDGEYSHSGGVQGSCSYHGGNWRPLLRP